MKIVKMLIVTPFKWIGGIIGRFVLRPLTSALLILGIVGSVALAIASLIGGNLLMGGVYKFLAVPCIAIGCFFGGFLFQTFMSNYIFRSNAVRKSDYDKLKEQTDKENAVKDEAISKLEKSTAEQTQKIAELEKRCRDMARQRIDINSFQPVMELALVEFDMTINDVKIKWLKDKIQLGKLLHDDKCPQYIGILDKQFKAKFGLDMKEVKVRRDESGKKLLVSGLKPTFIGIKDDKEKWLLREIQTFRLVKKPADSGACDAEDCLVKDGFLYEKDSTKEVETTLDLNMIKHVADEQRTELQERINTGFKAVECAEQYILHMGETFIRCLLSPITQDNKYEIVFCDSGEPGADSKPLLNFVSELDSVPT